MSTLDFDETIQQCRTASFGLGMVHRSDTDRGYVDPYRITHEDSWRKVSAEPCEHYGEAFVYFDNIALGEDTHGQADAVSRSNYRSLIRDFPDFPWVRVSYMNTDGLGCFVADLTEDMLGILVGLSVEYPLYDEEDHSELQDEEIDASWKDWISGEVYRELSEPCRSMWDALGDSEVTDMWWACVSSDVFGNYPAHHGTEVVWGAIKDRAADFRPFLIAAYVTMVRQGSALPAPWEWVPTLAGIKRDAKTLERLWRQFMHQELTLHSNEDWDRFLASKGYRTGPDGLVYIGTKGN